MIKRKLLAKKMSILVNTTNWWRFKKNGFGYEAKKAVVSSKLNVIRFITKAPNEIYRMIKAWQ